MAYVTNNGAVVTTSDAVDPDDVVYLAGIAIRKSDGAVLDRRQNNTFSDLDLLKIGLSFIPGAGQILAAINVADAARTGNWTQAAIGATGLVPGMQNVNTALRVG